MSIWQHVVANLLGIKPGEPKIYKPAVSTKLCKMCMKTKDVYFFHKGSSKCKPCQLIYTAEWKRRNKTWG